jgi:hypothetical protein
MRFVVLVIRTTYSHMVVMLASSLAHAASVHARIVEPRIILVSKFSFPFVAMRAFGLTFGPCCLTIFQFLKYEIWTWYLI